MIKAVFFDADDTLVDHKACEKQALQYLFNHIGIPYKDTYQALFRPLDRMLWQGTYPIPVSAENIPCYRFERLFELTNIPYDDYANANRLFKEGLTNAVALTEQAEELVSYLYDKGFLLCVLTNGLVSLQKPRITNSRIGKFITHILVSEEVGVPKPHPLMFNSMLERINIEASHAIMVGDSLEKDIQGAINVPMPNIWYNPDKLQNNTTIVPDFTITHLSQVKDIICV